MKITLTGPRSIGKTTVSKMLADKLGLSCISSDEIAEEYFKEHGGLDKAIKSGKIDELITSGSYRAVIDIYEKDGFVFDLSGGAFSSDKFSEASGEIRDAAKKNSIIVGMLPSKDTEESIAFLFEREKKREHFKGIDEKELLEKVMKSYLRLPKLFDMFCDIIIYTKGKSPEEVASEIVLQVGKNNLNDGFID
jgi:shikimate kinase